MLSVRNHLSPKRFENPVERVKIFELSVITNRQIWIANERTKEKSEAIWKMKINYKLFTRWNCETESLCSVRLMNQRTHLTHSGSSKRRLYCYLDRFAATAHSLCAVCFILSSDTRETFAIFHSLSIYWNRFDVNNNIDINLSEYFFLSRFISALLATPLNDKKMDISFFGGEKNRLLMNFVRRFELRITFKAISFNDWPLVECTPNDMSIYLLLIVLIQQ